MDAQCAGAFQPDTVKIRAQDVLSRAVVSTPFCYDYMCGDKINMTRCVDPEYSKVNNRRWSLQLHLSQLI